MAGFSATARLWRQSAAVTMLRAEHRLIGPLLQTTATTRRIHDEETARRLVLEANPPAIEAGRSDAEGAA